MSDDRRIWEGDFGDHYQRRNADPVVGGVKANEDFFAKILPHTVGVRSVIEFGAGSGLNLKALDNLRPWLEFTAVEVNQSAALALMDLEMSVQKRLAVIQRPIQQFNPIRGWDLSMTKGLLIHIHPDELHHAYSALYRSSKRYILLCEYYSPVRRMIPYRGENDALWAADYAGEMLDAYEDLEVVAYGFSWKRMDRQDDLTWTLLSK